MTVGQMTFAAGALLAAGIGATLIAGRLRLPGLVLFLGLGMAIGSDGFGWVAFDNYRLARTIGIIALALILFEGGLTAGFNELRPVAWPAFSLAIFGTLATAALAGVAAKLLFDFSNLESLLIGSILAGTDGAAVFALLRGSTLRRRLAKTLEGESGLNDPIAVLLVVALIAAITEPSYNVGDALWLFARQLGIGAAVGLLVGRIGVAGFERVPLATPGLYPVASVAVAALAFGAADTLHGSGFLAVYLAGLALGDKRIPAKRTVVAFHEGVASVAQIALFVVLGLLVFPSQLRGVALEATALALLLALVARPIATFIATAPFHFSMRERTVLGWAGLRGGVPVVLATFPVIDHVPRSIEFFNIVFFVVLVSTLVQGMTFERLAAALGVTTSEPAMPRPLAESGTIRALGAEVVEFRVHEDDAIAGLRVRELGLPRDALVNVVVRGDQALPPRGSMRIEAGDRLHVLVRQEVAEELDELTVLWRTGPMGRSARPRLPGSRAPVFSARPWSQERDGDAASPDYVDGVPVVEQLRTRRDVEGALVVLADGRYAVTGPVLASGGARSVEAHARRRLSRTADDAERAWWQEVLGAVALEGRGS
ncbi:MAG: potassium/hydrogen antiporter [Thermoleophilaceae bacterium]|jgi:cell volume regulation protein A|nr:potassium/hydrogen antiporter [Thermoleophilaceae bacterium]